MRPISPENNRLYFLGVSIYLLYWLTIFFFKPKIRKEMLFFSLLFAPMGPVLQYLFYIKDWWQPTTLLDTRVGVEDFVMAFSGAGIAVGLFLPVQKSNKLFKADDFDSYFRVLVKALPIGGCALALMFAGVYLMNWHSFFASILSLLPFLIWWLWRLPEKRKPILLSGILYILLSMPVFWILRSVSPQYIETTWKISQLSGRMVLGMPFEDFVWYGLAGSFASGLYYWLLSSQAKNISSRK